MQISVVGPFDIKGPGDTRQPPQDLHLPSFRPRCRRAPARNKILANLAHHAYRRPVTEADIAPLMKIYAAGPRGRRLRARHRGGAGSHAGLARLPVPASRAIRPAPRRARCTASATWNWPRASPSSCGAAFPTTSCCDLAEKGKLHRSRRCCKAQVRRMLADPQVAGADWTISPGSGCICATWNVRSPTAASSRISTSACATALQTETELFFDEHAARRPQRAGPARRQLHLLNQRLAEHYGIPGVYGTQFRRVTLDPTPDRGGLLGQGSILTVTSYPNRTSVVQRGKWILENLLGTPPPPPPPNVPALKPHGKDGRQLTLRQQMEQHRANPVCASCHTQHGPAGLRAWRITTASASGAPRRCRQPIDASGKLPDGTKFEGPGGAAGGSC